MKTKAAILILSLALCAAALLPARAQTGDTPREFRKGEVVVEIKPGASIGEINARIGTITKQQLYGTNFFLLRTPKNKKEAKYRKKLERDPDVLSASLNPVVTSPTLFGRSIVGFPDGYATTGKTQENFNSQTGLFSFLNLTRAHARSRGKGAVIALIDTGVDFNHQAIQPYIWMNNVETPPNGIDDDNNGLSDDYRGWDFVSDDNEPEDVPGDPEDTVAGHGTFIAALVALVAPDARIMPIRAFPPSGYGDEFTIASAIKYATDNGATVINLSFGAGQVSSILADAIAYAKDHGVVMVAASGNENSQNPQYPASSSDVMAVSAIDLTSRKARFSNFGEHVDVTAPGVEIISAYPGPSGSEYALWSGTSFAAPFAVAEAALIYALDPDHPDIKKAIEDTSDNIDGNNPGFERLLGKGRINLLKALECLNSDCTRTPRDFYRAATLYRSAGIPSGKGYAKVSVSGTKQEFEVSASELSPRTDYQLFVNGQPVNGRHFAGSLGYVRFYFSNDSTGAPISGVLDPVTDIRRVELRTPTGVIVLYGDLAGLEDPAPVGQVVQKEARLIPAGTSATRGGRAKIEVRDQRESLTIFAEGLVPGQPYRIFVDGVNLSPAGDFAVSGYLKASFTSDGSSGRALPLVLRPAVNIRHVEVRNQSGEIVLLGDFQPGTGNTGGGGTPTLATTREARFARVSMTSAEGKAKVRFGDGSEVFGVEISGLEAGAFYRIIVDTSDLGRFQANSAGYLIRGWSSDNGAIPDSIRPVSNIRRVQILTSTGRVILAAEFST